MSTAAVAPSSLKKTCTLSATCPKHAISDPCPAQSFRRLNLGPFHQHVCLTHAAREPRLEDYLDIPFIYIYLSGANKGERCTRGSYRRVPEIL
jgi:hypothetical protein